MAEPLDDTFPADLGDAPDEPIAGGVRQAAAGPVAAQAAGIVHRDFVLWDGRGGRERARRLATSARDRYAALGDDFAAQHDEASTWLAAHGAP